MRKFIIILCLICAGVGLSIASQQYPRESKEIYLAQENYRYVTRVRALLYRDGWYGPSYDLYEGVNTCDAYYLKIQNAYYRARKNTYQNFGGRDVSNYDWYVKCNDETIFFNY